MSTFESLSSQWDDRYTQHGWSNLPDPHLSHLVENLTPGRALDLGCGTGRNSVFLARLGWRVTGVDASAVGLQMASDELANAGLSWTPLRADLTTFTTEDRFDLVVVANIHLFPKDRDAFFARCATFVAPGGYLYVVGHHIDALGHQGPPDPTRLFTLDTFAAGLEGLETQRLERVESPADRDGHHDVEVLFWATRPTTQETL